MKYVFLLIFFSISVFAEKLNLDEVIREIDSDKSYQDLVSQCPSELFPKLGIPYKDHIDYCAANPMSCLKRCNDGDANYCSSLANYAQGKTGSEYHSEALFSKSCKLGLVNACTNRASGLIKYNGESSLNCAVKTFELSCSQGDAWGCTMYGAYLAQGKGVKRDFDKALDVLEIGCKNGIQDPACQNAKNISSQIKAVLSKHK
ncbi:sel1 repeat family protein [Endozoicomonas sp. G2_1]|uniref:tetratricopeptide repeat protein n=1 Tax=Endozoicomonas sp. G2_1 TaxID=2821091 RepID=UPI001ADC8ACF|nr:sel1 repeat family protein [Endozoicomonas sp. G2_1]MBO9492369.1 sel1 repeat family protein [Endozoicomonas sp. G2_1]